MPDILVVDDDRAIQDLYETVLNLLGHRVAGQAFDGRRAVLMYGALQPHPDIVVLDHRMPVMSGLEAARAIRAQHPAARIIFVSADTSVKKEALDAGALAFLAKPFALSELSSILSRILAQPRGPAVLGPAAAPA